jgi:proteasome lid subunit RPN8/RPN11
MTSAKNAAIPMKSQPTKQATPPMERQLSTPVLRMTPYAWAKLLFLRDAGATEIGGFGITSAADPLLVEDIHLVRQLCDWASVEFDDESVADFFDDQVDLGRTPEEFARIWVHTHPGTCPRPSGTDEATFGRVFGACDWAVMFILACGGETYVRLRFNVGPGGGKQLPVEVAFEAPFAASDRQAWQSEYAACVEPKVHDPFISNADDITPFDPWFPMDDYGWVDHRSAGEEAIYEQF